eukprot:13464603-Alexandrium_andersonii.AAC.1
MAGLNCTRWGSAPFPRPLPQPCPSVRGEQPGKTRLERLAAVRCSAGRPPGHPLAPRDGTRAVRPRAARPWGPAAADLERGL